MRDETDRGKRMPLSFLEEMPHSDKLIGTDSQKADG